MGILDKLFFPSSKVISLDGVKFEITCNDNESGTYSLDLMSIPSCAQAVSILSNDISQIALKVYLRTNNGRQRLRNNLDSLLTTAPNAYQTSANFWRQVATQMLISESFIAIGDNSLEILPQDCTFKYQTTLGEWRFATIYSQAEKQSLGISNPERVIKNDYDFNQVLHLYSSIDEYGMPFPLRSRFKRALQLGGDVQHFTSKLYNRTGSTISG